MAVVIFSVDGLCDCLLAWFWCLWSSVRSCWRSSISYSYAAVGRGGGCLGVSVPVVHTGDFYQFVVRGCTGQTCLPSWWMPTSSYQTVRGKTQRKTLLVELHIIQGFCKCFASLFVVGYWRCLHPRPTLWHPPTCTVVSLHRISVVRSPPPPE